MSTFDLLALLGVIIAFGVLCAILRDRMDNDM